LRQRSNRQRRNFAAQTGRAQNQNNYPLTMKEHCFRLSSFYHDRQNSKVSV